LTANRVADLIPGEVVDMFNIVKHRDFVLADDLPTWRETEELRLQKYGHDSIVVIRADIDPGQEPPRGLTDSQ
jgi:hypothetical protein